MSQRKRKHPSGSDMDRRHRYVESLTISLARPLPFTRMCSGCRLPAEPVAVVRDGLFFHEACL